MPPQSACKFTQSINLIKTTTGSNLEAVADEDNVTNLSFTSTHPNEIEDLRKENKKLKLDVKALRRQIKMMERTQLLKALNSGTANPEEVSGMVSVNEGLRNENLELSDTNEKLKDKILILKNYQENWIAQKLFFGIELTRLHNDIKRLNKELTETQEKAKTQQSIKQSFFGDSEVTLNQKITELEATIQEKQTEIQTKDQKIGNKENEIQKLRRRIQNLQSSIKAKMEFSSLSSDREEDSCPSNHQNSSERVQIDKYRELEYDFICLKEDSLFLSHSLLKCYRKIGDCFQKVAMFDKEDQVGSQIAKIKEMEHSLDTKSTLFSEEAMRTQFGQSQGTLLDGLEDLVKILNEKCKSEALISIQKKELEDKWLKSEKALSTNSASVVCQKVLTGVNSQYTTPLNHRGRGRVEFSNLPSLQQSSVKRSVFEDAGKYQGEMDRDDVNAAGDGVYINEALVERHCKQLAPNLVDLSNEGTQEDFENGFGVERNEEEDWGREKESNHQKAEDSPTLQTSVCLQKILINEHQKSNEKAEMIKKRRSREATPKKVNEFCPASDPALFKERDPNQNFSVSEAQEPRPSARTAKENVSGIVNKDKAHKEVDNDNKRAEINRSSLQGFSSINDPKRDSRRAGYDFIKNKASQRIILGPSIKNLDRNDKTPPKLPERKKIVIGSAQLRLPPQPRKSNPKIPQPRYARRSYSKQRSISPHHHVLPQGILNQSSGSGAMDSSVNDTFAEKGRKEAQASQQLHDQSNLDVSKVLVNRSQSSMNMRYSSSSEISKNVIMGELKRRIAGQEISLINPNNSLSKPLLNSSSFQIDSCGLKKNQTGLFETFKGTDSKRSKSRSQSRVNTRGSARSQTRLRTSISIERADFNHNSRSSVYYNNSTNETKGSSFNQSLLARGTENIHPSGTTASSKQDIRSHHNSQLTKILRQAKPPTRASFKTQKVQSHQISISRDKRGSSKRLSAKTTEIRTTIVYPKTAINLSENKTSDPSSNSSRTPYPSMRDQPIIPAIPFQKKQKRVRGSIRGEISFKESGLNHSAALFAKVTHPPKPKIQKRASLLNPRTWKLKGGTSITHNY